MIRVAEIRLEGEDKYVTLDVDGTQTHLREGDELPTLRASRPWEVLREGHWSAQPSLTLCGLLAKRGIPIVAIGGECPVHSGDACLFEWVELRAARTQVAALTHHAEEGTSE